MWDIFPPLVSIDAAWFLFSPPCVLEQEDLAKILSDFQDIKALESLRWGSFYLETILHVYSIAYAFQLN